MKEKNYGRVINVISTSVKMPIPNLGVSNTIRGAVASWAKTLSLEVAAFGITVNNVLPGYTETPRLQALLEGAAARTSSTVDKVTAQWKALVPAGRFAKPQEVAAAVAFLASPAAGYINGVSLPVDGGRTGCL
jgi:3-oxoacyl-[acyl-carrier protein] reductase